MNRRQMTFALFAGAACLGLPASAHHSFAMFDSEEVRTLRGRVVQFRWSNPHVALFVQVDGVAGREGIWAVELTSPGNLRRLGWSRTTLTPRDHVEVQINPMRNGQRGGGFRQVTLLETGETYTARLIDIERNS